MQFQSFKFVNIIIFTVYNIIIFRQVMDLVKKRFMVLIQFFWNQSFPIYQFFKFYICQVSEMGYILDTSFTIPRHVSFLEISVCFLIEVIALSMYPPITLITANSFMIFCNRSFINLTRKFNNHFTHCLVSQLPLVWKRMC